MDERRTCRGRSGYRAPHSIVFSPHRQEVTALRQPLLEASR